MSWNPTTDQLIDLNPEDGVRRRSDTFRFELIDQSETEVLGELHPDRSRAPTITNDTSASIPRQLRNFHLPDDELGDINVLTDRVRPFMRLQNGAEFQLGVFLWSDDSQPVNSWDADERFSTLGDKSILLNTQMLGSFGWGVGAGGTGGLNLALVFLALQVISLEDFGDTESSQTLHRISDPVAWSPGTTHRRAMVDLCDMAGVTPPWFDRFGKFLVIDMPDPEEQDPASTYRYGSRVIAESILRTDDLLGSPNIFRVYDSGPSSTRRATIRLQAAAPHSIENRGFAVPLVESRQGMETNAQARLSALALALTKGQAFDWITFESTLDPRHDTWDVIGFQFEDGGEITRWLETNWTMELRSGGKMKHTARRVYPIANT